ncbi:hypothetical protein Q8A73_003502 [Channa argus]|nr:hypothetical protein Q8A73_003502 [Channa argus]
MHHGGGGCLTYLRKINLGGSKVQSVHPNEPRLSSWSPRHRGDMCSSRSSCCKHGRRKRNRAHLECLQLKTVPRSTGLVSAARLQLAGLMLPVFAESPDKAGIDCGPRTRKSKRVEVLL